MGTQDGRVELDQLIDYRQAYEAALDKCKVSGNNMTAICPFHADKNASLSVELRTGKFHCFACGASGNYVDFYARTHGDMSTSEAYREILQAHGVEPSGEKRTVAAGYSVTLYSIEKRLPMELLTGLCRMSNAKERSGVAYAKLPYMDEHGNEVTYRKRYAPGSTPRFKWKAGSAGHIGLYGEWTLARIRELGYVILVEGESDTQTLWHLGLPALGCPGASMFKATFAPMLEGLRVYIHVEPDQGGQTFLSHTLGALHDGYFLGEVFQWSCRAFAQKDPSALYISVGAEETKARIEQAIASAAPIDLDHYTQAVPEAIQGAPVQLRTPEGYMLTDGGVAIFDPQTHEPAVFCRTPLLITRRLHGLDTDEERIEIAFKRDGEWHSSIQARSMVFQSRSITELAKLGLTVTSENAKLLVRYLGALEAENISLIPRCDSTTHLGWQVGNRFLPSCGGDLVVDVDPSMQGYVNGYSPAGTLEAWLGGVDPLRSNPTFRFIVSAAFAAPLLRLLNQRLFMLYNWGGSKGGKTAALRMALSAWGDPDRIVGNFNATAVALERMAGFYCDLPLGIDERQLAGDNQVRVERLVYMLSAGQGKARGTKAGGLQATSTWKTIILATGEEPLTTEASMTGVSTRVLELYGSPFASQEAASGTYAFTAAQYGTAGPAFVERLIAEPAQELRDVFDTVREYVASIIGRSTEHAASIAVIGTADILVDQWLYGRSYSDACTAACRMLDAVVSSLRTDEARDVNEYAVQFVHDWIMSNADSFTSCPRSGRQLGVIDGDRALVYPSLLSDALVRARYSPRKTLKYMAEHGMVATATEADGKITTSVIRWVDKRTCRVVDIDLKRAMPAQEDEERDVSTEGWKSANEDVLSLFDKNGAENLTPKY